MSEPAADQPLVEMQDVQVVAMRDPSRIVLENVNWIVRPAEFWVVAGPQRSGKSDLLLHAAGLIAPASGVCRGKSPRQPARSTHPRRPKRRTRLVRP